MLRKGLIGLVFAAALAFNVAADEIVVKMAPPHAIVEKRGTAPGAGYVWIPGYHRWDGHAYVWTAGKWDQPPHPHQVWVAHKWVHRKDGYVLVEGHWR